MARPSVSSRMMEACGEAEGRLASELMQHEVQIERDVLDPLNQLTEVKTKGRLSCSQVRGQFGHGSPLPQIDIPNILKQRKQLAKLVLDYDSAKAR